MIKTRLFAAVACAALAAGTCSLAAEKAKPSTRGKNPAKEMPPWKVENISGKTPEHFSVDNGTIYVSFNQGYAWTIAQVKYQDEELVGQYGANGTVSLCEKGLWGGDQTGFVGTGHGGEMVNTLHFIVDGKEHEYKKNLRLKGREIVVRKISKLGPFNHTAEITFPEAGDHFVEKHSYQVAEDAKGFKSMYAFMHCMNKNIKDWNAVLARGKEKAGRAADGQAKFVLAEECKSITCWGEANKKGVVYIYPEIYEGCDTFKNSIWDRAHDTKLYLRPRLPELKLGAEFSFTVKLVPFEATAEEWKEKGFELAKEYDFDKSSTGKRKK